MPSTWRADALQARTAIAAGRLRGATLRDRIRRQPVELRDGWLDVALDLPALPPDSPLPRGAVPYLPAGVDAILGLVERAPLRRHDTLVDIGAGLGRVVMLAALLTGATATGVELQAPLVAAARHIAASLGDVRVSFVHGDAREILPDGSVYVMYAPCNGAMLQAVLARLEAYAHRRAYVLVTIDLPLPPCAWLRPRGGDDDDAVQCFDAGVV
ncbi:MAG: class I SAM-dependent methyltransferase [Deltaproteobacteria bacterium]|nr:class I SAM-dependent methyltransferase [Deltaproteobacteria bacterium]MBP7290821.1 class I SAM-dependent methyltransferase [Nannocystaceae bacterium]